MHERSGRVGNLSPANQVMSQSSQPWNRRYAPESAVSTRSAKNFCAGAPNPPAPDYVETFARVGLSAAAALALHALRIPAAGGLLCLARSRGRAERRGRIAARRRLPLREPSARRDRA